MTGLRWSRRTTTRISEELRQLGIRVCPNTVARLLDQMGYSLRVNHKQISTDSSPDRNLQFEYLAELRGRFQRRHLPIISVDTKKRELVGNFRNAGRRWECRPRRVFDHDFRTDSIGVAIPYGIYDLTENRGAFVVGVSHDTPAFAAHAIAHWWQQEGSRRYSGSRQILILADTGGSNSYRCYAWKTELQSQLANSFALAVTVALLVTPAAILGSGYRLPRRARLPPPDNRLGRNAEVLRLGSDVDPVEDVVVGDGDPLLLVPLPVTVGLPVRRTGIALHRDEYG